MKVYILNSLQFFKQVLTARCYSCKTLQFSLIKRMDSLALKLCRLTGIRLFITAQST